MSPTDILFIHPNASKKIYQDLSKDFSAIEPPIWAGMLTRHCLTRDIRADILDCEALHLTDDQAAARVAEYAPKVACLVVYGQQPSASSQNMAGAVSLAEHIRAAAPEIKILFVGGHVAALPEEVLRRHDCIDFVCQNEGVYTISALMQTDLENRLDKIAGLGYRRDGGVVLNPPSAIVAKTDLAVDLPGIPWDMLPMDRYRTSLWHSYSNDAVRQPFAALYTSLGCPMKCSFCMINIINRQDNRYADGSAVFRFWDPEFIIQEFDELARRGIRNIKIADELFVLNANHFMKLCEMIIEREYDFNIWCYSRIDTVKERFLETLKKAGVNWLALGIESGNTRVRKDVTKGRFEDVDIRDIVQKIRDHGINVIANYIFGLPEDDHQSMQTTLDLALELNTEEANFYSAMAYPGSPLYGMAQEKGWSLPQEYAGYSQHSYEQLPLPTKYLSAAEVLAFRDDAWMTYHTHPAFLELIKSKFGQAAHDETVRSTTIKLKRRLLEGSIPS
ncbi:MAG: radical SAM protein [Candidatus Omnitrophica bacterium]|nr:radical SAM protein [Candidatus Omnitrophota bacterium]MCB9720597.1 radical SAM protein [Candidatus Omnitrophota bacterium]